MPVTKSRPPRFFRRVQRPLRSMQNKGMLSWGEGGREGGFKAVHPVVAAAEAVNIACLL
jgi:hypothetical protein